MIRPLDTLIIHQRLLFRISISTTRPLRVICAPHLKVIPYFDLMGLLIHWQPGTSTYVSWFLKS